LGGLLRKMSTRSPETLKTLSLALMEIKSTSILTDDASFCIVLPKSLIFCRPLLQLFFEIVDFVQQLLPAEWMYYASYIHRFNSICLITSRLFWQGEISEIIFT
jgi:hypothetical protein